MRGIVFLCAIAVAWAAAPPKECEWGESYWCSDLRIAANCNAVQHCKTTVWKNHVLDADDTEVCTFCQTVIGDVRKYIEDQSEQTVIKQYLEAACTVIPSQDLAEKCKEMVDEYLSIVLDLIASELDPQTVCAAMGLCQGFADKVTHAEIVEAPVLQEVQPVQEPAICTDCKKFFQDMKEMLTSPAMEKEIEQYLDDEVCAELGGLEDTCKELVDSYVPTFLQLVASEFDPAMVCGSFGFCNSSGSPAMILAGFRKHTLQQAPVKAGTTCTICKDIFGVLTLAESLPEVQSAIEDFIKSSLCAKLGDMKKACDSAVEQYAPVIFDLLKKELNADTICEDDLHLCGSNENSPQPGRLFVPKPQPATSVKSSTECVLCEFIMKEIRGMLVTNASQEEIIAALDKVCELLPDTISLQCKDFIGQYGPAVIQLLLAELDPSEVCKTLGLCSQEREIVLKVTGFGGEECGVCETIIQYMESLMEENATVQQIEAVADKVCNFLPKTMQKDCDDIIAQYAPALIHMITEYLDPNEVCTLLGMCNNQTLLKKSKHVGLTRLVAAMQQPSLVKMERVELLGKNECTWGPSHWCKNIETAKKCNTVEHCTKNVWSKKDD